EEPRRLAERERRLVAVVAVGDQQLRVAQLLGERVAELRIESPEPVAAAAQVGLGEAVDLDRPGPEEEERPELRPRRAAQPEAALLRTGVRALVRQDDAVVVGLRAERGDEALPRAGDAV